MFSAFLSSVFCTGSRKSPADDELSPKKRTSSTFKIPPHQGKYLVLDLDETLIHTGNDPFDKSVATLNFHTSHNKTRFYVAVRPHLKKFMEEMSHHYTIAIYTASSKEYAQVMIKRLGIEKYVDRLLHRADCKGTWHGLSKDLSIFNVPLKDIILIDDTIMNSHYQPDNFLMIEPFEGQKDDKALLKLIPFLKELATLEDVRHVDSRYVRYLTNLREQEEEELRVKQEKEKQDLKEKQEREAQESEKPNAKCSAEEQESLSSLDGESVSGSHVTTDTTLDNLDEVSKDSLLVRKAKGLYKSLVDFPKIA